MDDLGSALLHFATLQALLLLFVGTALGIIVGAVPGLTGAMLISLTVPLTYGMAHGDALILLVSMYVGSISGGLITATLLRMPGTPASIMTTLDGYPMARKGQPGRALGLGIMASFVGGLVSWLFLFLLARPMADLSIRLGPFELFSLILMALVLIASVSAGSLLAGVLSGLLGILATMPGTSPATGQLRWTFGFVELNAGFKLLPVLIGLFAVSQVLRDVLTDRRPELATGSIGGVFLKLRDWRRHAVNMARSSVIGTWIGMLPGIGANIASVLAYTTARNASKEPESFGTGSEEGIVASEAANNATVGGALIPLIALGIPGSVIDAILLGALTLHGLKAGPLLFQEAPDVVYTILATSLLANILMFLLALGTVRFLARLIVVPRWLLNPVVLVFCVIGSYALANRMFDVWVMVGFGVLGLVMDRLELPLAPFVIGFVLAPVAEENLCAGLMLSGGSYWPLITRPFSCVFFLLSLVLLAWPFVAVRFRRRRQLEKEGDQSVDDSST